MKPIILKLIVIITLLASLNTDLVPKKTKSKTKSNKCKELESENIKLKQQLKDTVKDVQFDLQKKIDKLEIKNMQLTIENIKLMRENRELTQGAKKTAHDKCIKESESVKKECQEEKKIATNTHKEEISRLNKENIGLIEQITKEENQKDKKLRDCKNQKGRLQQTISTLENQIQQAKNSSNDEQIKNLIKEKERLNLENANLRKLQEEHNRQINNHTSNSASCNSEKALLQQSVVECGKKLEQEKANKNCFIDEQASNYFKYVEGQLRKNKMFLKKIRKTKINRNKEKQ